MSDLKLRFLSALVLGPVVIALVYFGGFAYSAMILVAALLFQYEWFSITGSKALDVLTGIGYLSLVLSVVGYISGYPLIAVGVIVAGAALLYLVSGFSIRGRWGAEGLVYSGLALLSLVAARAGQDGLAFVVFLLVVVWATDIFAYFVGRFVGGPKLWRRVSPNKTWSGALGGLAFSIALGSLCAFLFGYTDLTGWALLAIALSLVSQAGDLLESAIKRRFDVKDSSRLIPGHGGIMDRIDGLVSAAILASALGLAFGGTLADPISGLGLS
ncbi:MAG: phosphatidate cytidylyltransferase [Rhodobacteraceae bacterium]|nr:phosphatidate cytidylyltransferase [Paracoccaceae bacterium]